MWLQMIGQANQGFVVVSPANVVPDYAPDISPQDIEFLGIRTAADRIAGGDLSHRVAAGGDELGRLGKAINHMAAQLDARIREQADSGAPTVVSDPASPAAQAFHAIARRAAGALAASAIRGAARLPAISIEGE